MKPRLTVGMPVYNGERFLEQAIRSLLRQTFENFELVISDNASGDRTPEICRELAGKDDRIRYHRADTNRGAAWNYNHVFELATGEFFMWCAHDDMHEPESLRSCIEAIDADPGVVLAYPRVHDIDEEGKTIRKKSFGPDVSATRPHIRFRRVIQNDHTCEAVFGIVRAQVLAQTPLMGNYVDSDRVLLASLGLWGRFHEVPEYHFLHRLHSGASTDVFVSRQTRSAWFDPTKAGKPAFPWSKEFLEYLKVIWRSPLKVAERARCLSHMLRWLLDNRRGVIEDYTFAARHLLRPLKRAVIRR